MAISMQSLPASPWTLQQQARDLGPPSFTVKPSFLQAQARRRRFAKCCIDVKLSEVTMAENASLDGSSHGLHLHESQSNGHSLGWLKIGRSVCLGIGLALGAHYVIAGRGGTVISARPLPVNEQTMSSNLTNCQADHRGSDDALLSSIHAVGDQAELQKLEGEMDEENVMYALEDNGNTDQIYKPSKGESPANGKNFIATFSSADNLGTIQSSSALVSNLDKDLHEEQTSELTSNFLEHGNSANIVYLPPVPSEIGKEIVNHSNILHVLTETFSEQEVPSTLLSTSNEVAAIINNKQDCMCPSEKMISEDANFSELHSQNNLSGSSVVGILNESKISTVVTDNILLNFSPHFGWYNDASKTERKRDSSVSYPVQEITADMDFMEHIKSDKSNNYPVNHTSALGSHDCHMPTHDTHASTIPPATLQEKFGKFGDQIPVDNVQEQAVTSLQALKIIEACIEPGALCTRREYARWLIKASDRLARSPAHKVFPAMYIEDASECAFDDVLPQDPDFPYIQGLAEAGIISSKLTVEDRWGPSRSVDTPNESKDSFFLPQKPLSRQDLISWNFALARHLSPSVSKEALQAVSGFLDIDKIRQDAWAALFADLSAGDRSIIALAFGNTRRFQPNKPVTKAQAAIALSAGEAADLVSEKLARLQVESITEDAIAAHSAFESKDPLVVATSFNHLLEEEKAKKEAAEKLVESTLEQLKRLKAESDEQKNLIAREHAVIESEREFLSKLQKDIVEKSESSRNANLEVAFEKDRIQKLHKAAEFERRTLENFKTELEVQKKAFTIAKSWAEEEARKAYSHAKVLEAARKRWGSEAVQAYFDKDLAESNMQANSLQYSQSLTNQSFTLKLREVIARLLHNGEAAVSQFRSKSIRSFEDVTNKVAETKDLITSMVATRAEQLQQFLYFSANHISSGLREGTRKVINESKEGAEKLAHKFKAA